MSRSEYPATDEERVRMRERLEDLAKRLGPVLSHIELEEGCGVVAVPFVITKPDADGGCGAITGVMSTCASAAGTIAILEQLLEEFKAAHAAALAMPAVTVLAGKH